MWLGIIWGSVRLVMDENGGVVARHDYLPFGEEVAAGSAGRNTQWGSGNDTVAQKFTGKERDAESGLDYFGARYYGSALGRFTSTDPENAGADPYNPQSWNAYSYVLNNPLTNIDPFGQSCQRLSNGPLGETRFAGDCSSPEDLAVTQGDQPQRFNVDDRGGMTTELSGVTWSVGPNGLAGPTGERSLRDDTVNLISQPVLL